PASRKARPSSFTSRPTPTCPPRPTSSSAPPPIRPGYPCWSARAASSRRRAASSRTVRSWPASSACPPPQGSVGRCAAGARARRCSSTAPPGSSRCRSAPAPEPPPVRPSQLLGRLHRVHLTDRNLAAEGQVRVVTGESDRLVVALRADREIAAEHLLGLAVRPI